MKRSSSSLDGGEDEMQKKCSQIPDISSLKRLKVNDLKYLCDDCGVGKKGLKNDLIGRLDAARSGKHFYDLFSESGEKLKVSLTTPTKEDECPLTLDTVDNDSLEFLPTGVSFVERFPSMKKMSLPCGHQFGALNIVYHFVMNNMQCPCCRRGPTERASLRCIPAHFRPALRKHVRKQDEKKRREQDRQSWDALASLNWRPNWFFDMDQSSDIDDHDYDEAARSGDDDGGESEDEIFDDYAPEFENPRRRLGELLIQHYMVYAARAAGVGLFR